MSDLTDIRDRITRLTFAAGLPGKVWSELCEIDSEFRAALRAQAASAERVRAVVREAIDEYAVVQHLGLFLPSSKWSDAPGAIADRVVEQLTAPPPGHV